MKVRRVKRSEAKRPLWERGANPEQLQVIRWEKGPLRVLAAAGSGKTRCLCARVVRLIEELDVDPKRILATTFSKKAADEMTKRIEKDYHVVGARVGTWHSLCLQILREDKTKYAEWRIEDDGPGTNTKMVLKEVLGFKHMKWEGSDINSLESFIGICKANLWTPDSPEAQSEAPLHGLPAARACEAFHRYNEMLVEKEILSFDDFLVYAVDHLKDEDNRKKWAARWDYVLCDEVQDNCEAQSYIATLLAGDHQNYMVVGDIYQSIYGFRGASPEYLANFEKYWPGAHTIVLPRNYRSGQKIIEVANNIVKHGKVAGTDPMIMLAERKEEGKVFVTCHESLDDEAHSIANTIMKSVGSEDSEYSDHTILYRTNAQSRAIEEALLKQRIPYIVVGGVSFYERKEVRDLLGYLRLAAKRAKVDDIKRCINTPFRFLGNAFVSHVMSEVDEDTIDHADWVQIVEYVADHERLQSRQRASANDWASMIRTLQESIKKGESPEATDDEKAFARPAALLDDVIRKTRYIDFINKEEGSESPENSGAANVRELVRVAENFPNASEFLDYIDDTIRKAREQRKDKQAGGKRVLLMTVHRSKALEWDNVYVIAFNSMILPHVRGEIEEERRLAYVAVTRARENLFLSYVRRIATRAGIKDVFPSPFLVDTGLFLDNPRAAPALLQSPAKPENGVAPVIDLFTGEPRHSPETPQVSEHKDPVD